MGAEAPGGSGIPPLAFAAPPLGVGPHITTECLQSYHVLARAEFEGGGGHPEAFFNAVTPPLPWGCEGKRRWRTSSRYALVQETWKSVEGGRLKPQSSR